MITVAGRILELLKSHDSGLTARQIADELCTTPGHISSRLSKLVAYGILKKTTSRNADDTECRIYTRP